jgi:hypothetical protein
MPRAVHATHGIASFDERTDVYPPMALNLSSQKSHLKFDDGITDFYRGTYYCAATHDGIDEYQCKSRQSRSPRRRVLILTCKGILEMRLSSTLLQRNGVRILIALSFLALPVKSIAEDRVKLSPEQATSLGVRVVHPIASPTDKTLPYPAQIVIPTTDQSMHPGDLTGRPRL